VRLAYGLIVAATVAACGTPANSGPDTVLAERIRAPLAAADIDLRVETRALVDRIASGMTLASLLQAAQLPGAEAIEVIEAVRAVFDPRKVRIDQPYRLVQTIDGALRQFEYEIDNDRFLRVTRPRGATAWAVDILPIPKTHSTAVVEGSIDRQSPSLFESMGEAGGTVDLSLALADIFSGDIDFNTELQPGDRFALVVDKQFREGDVFAGYGPIFAAEFDNDGRRLRAIRYTPEGGPPGYFDERGVSMRRFMLKSPLKFDPVVTSGFSRSRVHPVLGGRRPHLGVDYRAPTGAPVVAVAGGVVVRAGMNGGAGRMVHLRHANGFETEYLHLSSTAVRAGTRVEQGDLIGRVGSTGLATGPHLDYRVKKSGVFINPLTVAQHLPPSDPVPEEEMEAFIAVRDRALQALPTPAALPAAAEGSTP
jgi:murein DD-endopeptidase MepM/ murein hydrolase activator NlpD